MKWLFNLFRKQINDQTLFETFGNKVLIRNGVGYGFISDEFLYHNSYLEVGIGRVYSGYGDWGGGATHASDAPIKLILDKNFNIINIKTSSFYNSPASMQTEKIALKLKSRMTKQGYFKFTNPIFVNILRDTFEHLPAKFHIGMDVKIDDAENCRWVYNCYCEDEKQSSYRILDANPELANGKN